MLTACDTDFLAKLSGLLPPDALAAPEPRYLEEPRGRLTGQGGAVALPRNVEEVSVILRACHAAHVPVIPYGGGTGLVGGQVGLGNALPLILSLERMQAIRQVYPTENVLVAEAGAILADVQRAAEMAGRLFPLSLASEGSARIGGLLACNAGGVNVLRYGNARDLTLGLEVVLADGRIWHGLKRLRKDNTGYDLRHLMIGSEGTLGVITAASLRLSPRPAVQGAALMVVDGPKAALSLLALAQARLGDGISAFELISGTGLAFLAETMTQVRQPFAVPPDWMVLIDLGLPAGADASDALERVFADALEQGLVRDGVIAANLAQRKAFWSLRESIPEANRHIGAIASHDISLPLSEIAPFIAKAGQALARIKACRINCFGHLGDGNLHYNVFPATGHSRAAYDGERAQITTCVHDLVHQMGGSVSAEHGIGRIKAADLVTYGDPVKLAMMRAIKTALDPHGILNPGAVLMHDEMQGE
ncbi:FAD/FMN-containing dehydrogenase [Roseinatronobacter thiooxidans]|uniref:FAD/FMN-containing dehydrogenase n=1 Tax=Roseinatronobacter thiooxidans TaxID=121821 RepID=A0A2W7QGV7_9RHOB|nr:FAD-binding oxidoreductase [Roseinatronobacter thiooxidans]PZX46556.1 FAD/FMN-containing dehydrogenase [Roseinatronobacter thiooxidans]